MIRSLSWVVAFFLLAHKISRGHIYEQNSE